MMKYSLSKRIPVDADNRYKKHVYRSMRHEFGKELFDILDKQNSKCVVELVENRGKVYELNTPCDEIRFDLHLTDVSYQHFTAPTINWVSARNESEDWIQGIIAMLWVAFIAITIPVLLG